ncbi:hypothetical protein AALP_AA3G331200 [Arabis alpina]|uniref:Pentacotripeptide-repeat region of PRORP domain-containing protein n=1 Tax=Arabis alpina TaxID=50452 RepID=A0A087HDA3_ARAAL|nr:hypothetical protein AALP_AA3G331200 [Arabis alpina]
MEFDTDMLSVRRLFDEMSERDVISYSVVIRCYVQRKEPVLGLMLFREMRILMWEDQFMDFVYEEALKMFRLMGEEAIEADQVTLVALLQMKDKPNAITVINLLDACSVSADLRKSKWAHGIAIRRGLATAYISVDTSIVDAYAKCGAIEIARRTVDQIPTKNVISWTVIISAYAINGLPDKALASFEEMKREGYTPNAVTYLAVLSACNHGGMITQGLMIFKSMIEGHNKPWLQHYSCIVDMLSRAGEFDTAMELIKNLPEDVNPGASTWGSILSGCKNRLKSGIIPSEAIAEVLELEPLCSSGYLLASSVFAAEKSWDDVATMRRLVKERNVRVVAGYSMVLEGTITRRFLAGEKLSLSDCELNDVVHSLHRCMRLDDTLEWI